MAEIIFFGEIRSKTWNMTLESFLESVISEAACCTITISTLNNVGTIYIDDGEVVAALTDDLADEKAIMKMMSWDYTLIEIQNECPQGLESKHELTGFLMKGVQSRNKALEDKIRKEGAVFSKHEKMIESFIERGDLDTALKLLLDLIADYARRRQFIRADALRERLMAIAPMEITRIVEAGDIIEDAKSAAIDRNHFDIWSKLYNGMSTEEANAMFFAMQKRTYRPDEYLFRQGDDNANLYLIDQGQLTMVYFHINMEVLLKRMGPGDMAGEDSFFPVTVCTTSVFTLSPAAIYVLDRDVLKDICQNHPRLENKLNDYCIHLEKVSDLINKKKINRRSHERFKIEGKVSFQVLDASGMPLSQSLKGDLENVSSGGASFYITSSKKDSIRRLLGRNLRVTVTIESTEMPIKPIERDGVVVSVIDHHFNNFSVHIQFGKFLPPQILTEIRRSLRTGSKRHDEFI